MNDEGGEEARAPAVEGTGRADEGTATEDAVARLRPDEEMERTRSTSEPGAEPIGQMASEAPASHSGDTEGASPGPIRTERRRMRLKSPCVLATEEDQAVDNAFISQGPGRRARAHDSQVRLGALGSGGLQ